MVNLTTKFERISLSHGAGGAETAAIIQALIMPNVHKKRVFGGVGLDELDDGSTVPLSKEIESMHIVVSGDSYTVYPFFFPGGDIGKLAAVGTINDISVMGAVPLGMLDLVVVEEGFLIPDLERILTSFKKVLRDQKVALIGGDFKVMPKGKLDGIVISTFGIGISEKPIVDTGLKPGDNLIVNAPIGEHGAAILASLSNNEVEKGSLRSDVAPITDAVKTAMAISSVHAAKDLTRGGLAQALNDLALKNKLTIHIDEERIPIRDEVQAYTEMLGVDPLDLACEGTVLMAIQPESVVETIEALRKIGYARAINIGEVREGKPGYVLLETLAGGTRIVEPPSGELVPRIC